MLLYAAVQPRRRARPSRNGKTSLPGGFRDPQSVKTGVFREQSFKQILASPRRFTPPPRPGGRSRNGKIRNGGFLVLPIRTTPTGAVKHPGILRRGPRPRRCSHHQRQLLAARNVT